MVLRIRRLVYGLGWVSLMGQFCLAPVQGAETRYRSLVSPPLLAQTTCQAQLTQKIDRLLQQSDLATSSWGIVIQNAQTQAVLYEYNGDRLLVPASNVKLLTTGAALLKLGADYQFKTPVYVRGQAPYLSQLVIVGQGDPTVTTDSLKAVITQLQNQGITQIQELILVDKVSPSERLPGTWEWEDLVYDYAPPVNQAILNENAVTLTVKSAGLNQPTQLFWSEAIAGQQWQVINQSRVVAENPRGLTVRRELATHRLIITGELVPNTEEAIGLAIPDPSGYFLDTFKALLQAQKITVNRLKVITELPLDKDWVKLAEISSPKLGDIIAKINQESNNLYAEALLNLLKNQDANQKEPILSSFPNTNLSLFRLKDGSGLSRQNLISPRLFTQVLFTLKNNVTYRDSLATSGQTGTLKNRFLNTPLANNLQGKTGTLTGVSSLSGYLTTATQQPIIFSLLVNNSLLPGSNLRSAFDQILLWTAQDEDCVQSF
ncbi:MAG: D-alanyl-D-alanine carboxypeptidase/D-alanyl-D-alanine-endopeptidase [Microcystaceae cyanobacterium]